MESTPTYSGSVAVEPLKKNTRRTLRAQFPF